MKHCRMRDGGIVVKPLGAGDDLGQSLLGLFPGAPDVAGVHVHAEGIFFDFLH